MLVPWILLSRFLDRCYPEPYQILLDTGNGKNRLILDTPDRPTNSYFRQALSDGLLISGVTKDDLKQASSLIWWEKEMDKESSSNWRT